MRPTHTEVQPHAFIGDGEFVTKDGGCGAVIRLRPLDSECMDEVDQAATAHIFRTAVRTFGSDCTVYQYLIKRTIERVETSDAARADYLSAKGLYSFDIYLVIVRDGADSVADAAESFCQQVAESLRASVAGKAEAYMLFRRLLNYDETVARSVAIKYDDHVGYFAADSPIEAHRGMLRVGDHWTKVMTIKDPPTETKADLIKPLREMDCECVIVTEWRPMTLQAARDFIQSRASHFHRSKYVSNFFGSALGKMSGSKQEERPEDMQKDQSAAAMETQLGELLVDIEKNGTQLGEFAMTVILFDLEKSKVEKSSAEVFKAMAKTGAVFYQEKHNTLAAWFAALPGGRRHQRRALYLTDRNYADMSMLFAPDTGNPRNERLNTECLAVMCTRQKAPIYLNTHYGDVGHMLYSGMIGSGKTFTVNHLLGEAIARNNPRIVIFDISGANRSYFDLIQGAGGSYAEIGLDCKFKINPWCLDPSSRANVHFQYSFVKVLIESREYRMTGPEENLLYRIVKGCGRLRDVAVRLESIASDERRGRDTDRAKAILPHLERWIEGGQYAGIFDNDEDTVTYARQQAFEFEALEEYPEILEPFLFYALHRATVDLTTSGEYGIFVLDEAWKFLLNETVRQYLFRALKTWRKKTADVWIATQSIDDMAQTNMLRAVAENSGWVVLLPNPRMDRDQYKLVFKLNETELDLVATMTPKSEGLWKPAVGPSKVVILDAGVTK